MLANTDDQKRGQRYVSGNTSDLELAVGPHVSLRSPSSLEACWSNGAYRQSVAGTLEGVLHGAPGLVIPPADACC